VGVGGGGGEEPRLRAEPAQQGLQRDAGATGDLVERDLLEGALGEDLLHRLDEATGRGLGGLRPRSHPVCALPVFHVSKNNMKTALRQKAPRRSGTPRRRPSPHRKHAICSGGFPATRRLAYK
jgi:hypothetical protein